MSVVTIAAGAGGGFLVGGPVGAVIGGVAGAMLPKKQAVVVPPPNAAPSAAASADVVNAIVNATTHPMSGGIVPMPGGGMALLPGYTGGFTVNAPHAVYSDYGEMSGKGMWLLTVLLGTAAYVMWRR